MRCRGHDEDEAATCRGGGDHVVGRRDGVAAAVTPPPELHGDAEPEERTASRHDSGHFEFDAGAARVDATGRFDALPPTPRW